MEPQDAELCRNLQMRPRQNRTAYLLKRLAYLTAILLPILLAWLANNVQGEMTHCGIRNLIVSKQEKPIHKEDKP